MSFDTVKEAAKELDVKYPGWEKKITKPLEMSETYGCVLGQVTGNYSTACRELGLRPLTAIVFDDPKYIAQWTAEINKRLAKPGNITVKNVGFRVMIQVSDKEWILSTDGNAIRSYDDARLAIEKQCTDFGESRFIIAPLTGKVETWGQTGWAKL